MASGFTLAALCYLYVMLSGCSTYDNGRASRSAAHDPAGVGRGYLAQQMRGRNHLLPTHTHLYHSPQNPLFLTYLKSLTAKVLRGGDLT